jgi:tRNA-specific 2-thiouridylase
VSAYLLKSQGYKVSGIYMRNWSEADEAYCSGQDDMESVDRVAHMLDIPYKVVDFQKEYWNGVFEPVLEAYQAGITPNPDVLCNKEIKFKSLTDFVFSRSPAPDFLATGHYAQLKPDPFNPEVVNLCEAADPNKDQTYFLLQVSQAALKRVMFPIGHLLKPQVREIANNAKLPNATRKESMGLCFVGKRKFDEFIGEFTARPGSRPGSITYLETGESVGVHKGAMFYTVGQSANISGAPERMFVVRYACKSSLHPHCR